MLKGPANPQPNPPPDGDSRSFVRKLLAWGRENQRDFPWRRESDPFRVLVAEILLQRSRGTTVAGVYEEVFRRWPDAPALAQASVDDIQDVIRPLGLVQRARSLQRLAAQVEEAGGVPRSLTEMVRLAGVGRYAAAATAASAMNRRQPTVDGTSARVYRRFFGLGGPRDAHVDDELWELAEWVTPKHRYKEWNWAVLDLAAAICLPKVPRCPECPLRKDCVEGRSRLALVSDTPVT